MNKFIIFMSLGFTQASAQTFPSGSVKLVVPLKPGSGAAGFFISLRGKPRPLGRDE